MLFYHTLCYLAILFKAAHEKRYSWHLQKIRDLFDFQGTGPFVNPVRY